MKKYVFNPSNIIFPELFNREEERILSLIKIAIAVNKQDMDSVSKQLQIMNILNISLLKM